MFSVNFLWQTVSTGYLPMLKPIGKTAIQSYRSRRDTEAQCLAKIWTEVDTNGVPEWPVHFWPYDCVSTRDPEREPWSRYTCESIWLPILYNCKYKPRKDQWSRASATRINLAAITNCTERQSLYSVDVPLDNSTHGTMMAVSPGTLQTRLGCWHPVNCWNNRRVDAKNQGNISWTARR